jgi:hypothetical protein
MWDKAQEAFDYVIAAPDRNGNIKVKLTFLPTGTTVTESCKREDLDETKKKLERKVRKLAKETLAAQKGSRGSSASKLG